LNDPASLMGLRYNFMRRVPVAKSKAAPAVSATGRLAGKIAVVTGAAGNLGGHIVTHYLAEGATVVMTGRTPDRTKAAADALLKAAEDWPTSALEHLGRT
jgi:3-oxoacyl-ACP reductase-like protein